MPWPLFHDDTTTTATTVTGQLADRPAPTRGLPTRGLVSSRTGQVADAAAVVFL